MSTAADINQVIIPQSDAKPLGAAKLPKPIVAQTALRDRAGSQIDTHEVTAKSTDGLFLFTVKVIT